MPSRQAERRLRKIDEQLHALSDARARMRADEYAGNLEPTADGDWTMRQPAIVWTEQAGRVRCTTAKAFMAIIGGAPSHPDARPEPVAQMRHPWRNPYAGDHGFWQAVMVACRKALGQKEPVAAGAKSETPNTERGRGE